MEAEAEELAGDEETTLEPAEQHTDFDEPPFQEPGDAAYEEATLLEPAEQQTTDFDEPPYQESGEAAYEEATLLLEPAEQQTDFDEPPIQETGAEESDLVEQKDTEPRPIYEEQVSSRTSVDLPSLPTVPHPDEDLLASSADYAHVDTVPLPMEQQQDQLQKQQSKKATHEESQRILAQMQEEDQKEQQEQARQRRQSKKDMHDESERILAEMREEDQQEQKEKEDKALQAQQSGPGFNRYAVPSDSYDDTDPVTTSTYDQPTDEEYGYTNETNWVAYTDDQTGSTYWCNTNTGETSWDEPLGAEYTWGDQETAYYGEMMNNARSTKLGPTPTRSLSTRSMSSSGLNDGLGSNFLNSAWLLPNKTDAESFMGLNMFGNGNAHVCETAIHEFGQTSVGVRAMFELFLSLAKLIVVSFILAVPACIVYSSGNGGSEYVYDFTAITKLSAASSGLSEIAANNSEKIQGFTPLQASELVSGFDWFTSLIMFFYLFYIRHNLSKIGRAVHLESVSASSYTIEISKGLPTDITEQELIEHFSRLYALNTIDYKGRRKVKQMNIKDERSKYDAREQKKKKAKNNNTKGAATGTSAAAATIYAADGTVMDPLDLNYGLDETPVDNVDHNNDEKYLQSWIADVVLVRDEGDIIRHYQHLEVLDTKVRHQRALVKKVSPGTACEKGPDRKKAEKYMNHLIKLEFQQQQGLLSFKDPGPNTLPVVKAFVTFNNIESFERCVADYDAMWRRAVCCPCCPGNKVLRLRYKNIIKVTPAPEPSDILFENQGEYIHKCAHRWRFWSSICVVVLVLLLSLLLILSTYIVKKNALSATSSEGGTENLCGNLLPKALTTVAPTTTSFQYKRGTWQQDIECQRALNSLTATYMILSGNPTSFPIERYNMTKCTGSFHSCAVDVYDSQMCPCGYSDSTTSCTHIDSGATSTLENSVPLKSSPVVETFAPTGGDISVCYCIQKLNRLTLVEGNTGAALSSLLKTDSDVCSVWLEASAVGAGWSVAGSMLIAVVNGILGVTISAKSKTSRPASVSEKDTQIFLIFLIAQMFNSIVLTVFINAKINMFDLESIGDYPDFSRAWFASAGSALTSTMLILAVSIHVLPLMKCLRFRIKRKRALKNAHKFVSQQELNDACVGPDYQIEYRLTSVLVPVTACIMFGTFLPLLYPIALLAVLLAFAVDKALIITFHKRPPSTDASIPMYATDALIISTCIRIALSCWIFSIDSMFVSEDSSGSDLIVNSMSSDANSNFFVRISKATSLPHMLLLLLFLCVLIAREILDFTLGSVLETLAYWLVPTDCHAEKKEGGTAKQIKEAIYKPPFTAIFSTVIKPMHLGAGRSTEMQITHKVPEKQMMARGWCHVCKNSEYTNPCVDPHCTEWHYRRKRWLNNGVVQGLSHSIGDFAKTWEVIRVNSLHSYRIQNNENYIHVMHLRNEDRFVEAADDYEKEEENGGSKNK